MKNPVKFLIFPCLALAWCMPLFSKNSQWHYFLFIGCFLLGCLFLLLIKNKLLALPLAIISIIPPIFFDNIYLLYSLGTTALITEYLLFFGNFEKTDKKTDISYKKARIKKTVKQEKRSVFLTLPLLSCAAFILTVCASAVILISGKYSEEDFSLSRYNSSRFILLSVLIFLFVLTLTVFLQKSNPTLNSLNIKLHYLSSALCFLLNLLTYYLTDISTVADSERLFFFPWLIFLGILSYKNDSVISLITDKIMPVRE